MLCKPKNTGDQTKFKTSCPKNKTYPHNFGFSLRLTAKRINDIKIIVYKAAQAGAKTHAGGLKGGKLRV